MANTQLVTIDLSTGILRPVTHSGLIVLSSIETPWNDFLKFHEAEVTASDSSEPGLGGDLVGLRLTASIGPEWRPTEEPLQPQPALGERLSFDKEELMPNWRQPAGILFAELNPMLLARVAHELFSFSPTHLTLMYPAGVKDQQIQHIMLALRAEVEESCPAGRLFGESLATTLAIHVVRRYAILPKKAIEHRGGLPVRRLRNVTDYIKDHLGEEVTLHRLAEVAQMSPFHFGHMFKQSTGLSPHQFFLRQRIDKAKQLLSDQRLSLVEISAALGFASQAHFTSVFRKLAGITPRVYRNMR